MIYLDHAATTPVRTEVRAAMEPFWGETFGNPSSMYHLAREGRRALDQARDRVAAVLGCRSAEITFTSGGSESDNQAVKGVAFARGLGCHVITSQVEHHAVLHAAQFLDKLGCRVTYLPVDRFGRVNPDDVGRAIASDTALVSIMYANNEVGTIEPVSEIAQITRSRGVPLHVDAVQAAGALSLAVDQLGADLLTLSSHKFYGPKGVGVLYVRRGVACWPLIHGGGQERGRRAGTENVPGIVGLATALELADASRAATDRIRAQRDRLIARVLHDVPGARLTGHPEQRLPNHASFCIDGISGESLLLALDRHQVMASTGSACTSGSLEPSHVLLALGYEPKSAQGSLRLTLGQQTTDEEIGVVTDLLPRLVTRLRTFEATGGTADSTSSKE